MQLNRGFSNSALRAQPESVDEWHPGPHGLVARSLPMRRILEQLKRLGSSRFILIEGEEGTGKRLLSTQIHGARAESSGASSSSGGTGDHIFEEATALFGGEGPIAPQGIPERTAATAAAVRAADGVLVIRGIETLDGGGQERLLRFIRSFENEASIKGRERLHPSRIICTSRQPLRVRVLNQRFLPELYYRLSAVCFFLPPLRERKEDIPGLAQLCIENFSRERRRPLQGLGQGSLAVLLRHRWPGNVREFESVIRAACFAAESQWIRPIDLVILPLDARQPVNSAPAPPQDFSLDGVIRRHVQTVLKLCSGNKARAAARLGISRSTLYRMLEADHQSALHSDLAASRPTAPDIARHDFLESHTGGQEAPANRDRTSQTGERHSTDRDPELTREFRL